MSAKSLKVLVSIALALALLVILLGAYTRLTDAGLGCPDWPGCYGHLAPKSSQNLTPIDEQYAQSAMEPGKAWTEMIHRYAAGTLALLIFFLALNALYSRDVPWKLPVLLIFLVLFQALLGMWTVTLKLWPVVVMSHLLGGMLIFASLVRYRLQLSPLKLQESGNLQFWIYLGIFLLFGQIALGGWVSANYAGVACIGFPSCNGIWLPSLHFSQGFYLLSPVGANYQGGLLENEIRVSIQMVHRFGAIITALYILTLSAVIFKKSEVRFLKGIALFASALVLVQFSLGIINVLYLLPLPIALAHNGVAALLFAALFSMPYVSKRRLAHAC